MPAFPELCVKPRRLIAMADAWFPQKSGLALDRTIAVRNLCTERISKHEERFQFSNATFRCDISSVLAGYGTRSSADSFIDRVYEITTASIKMITAYVKPLPLESFYKNWYHKNIFPGSSMVEQRPVKAMVVGSSPTRGAYIKSP